jgi:hypothetical protein
MTDYNVIPVEKPRTNGYVTFQELTRFHGMVDLEFAWEHLLALQRSSVE